MPGGVSVIIRCFNEEAHIGRLLSGLARQTVRPDEIVLVDSGSTDATLAIASAFDVRIVHIASSEFSFGRALNLGIGESNGDIAVLASAHVYPIYDTWLERLLAPFATEDVALAYGRQTAPSDGPYSESRLLGRWFPAQSIPRQRHPFCNNANAAVRRSVWLQHPYDEDLTGLEDLEFAKRALAAGHVLAYVAEAPVVHGHTEDFGQITNRYRREAIAHKQIYAEQRMGLASAMRLAVANIAEDLQAAHRQGELGHHTMGIARFRIAQFYGTYRGFGQQGPVTELLKHRFFYPTDAVVHHHAADATDTPIGLPIDYDMPLPDNVTAD